MELLTIDSAGAAFGPNARTGCVVSGNVDPVDTRFNVYRARLTFNNGKRELAGREISSQPRVLDVALDQATTLQHEAHLSADLLD